MDMPLCEGSKGILEYTLIACYLIYRGKLSILLEIGKQAGKASQLILEMTCPVSCVLRLEVPVFWSPYSGSIAFV